MPRVVFGTGDTDSTLPGAHSLVWLMRKDVEGRNPTHLEKSVANETIQLKSTNSECSQVPSRWGIGWARSCSSRIPKQLANSPTTWHISSASWQKDTEKE